MASSTPPRPPDVVLVVVDCARSSDPSSRRSTSPDLVAEVPADFVHYPRAAAAATWSLPSHASLFTGLYPWNHRCHNLAGLHLNPGHVTVAGRLREAGYATAAFSSNSILTPDSGLLAGFDLAAWGRWSENIFRSASTSPPHLVHLPARSPPSKVRGKVASAVASSLRHVPAVGYTINQVARRFQRRGSDGVAPVSPWIEPTFDRWLSSVPSERRIFSVINLMDLHEPYLPERPSGRRNSDLLRFSLIPQDGRSYSERAVEPPLDWVTEVRHLYSDACRVASGRIRSVWESLERHGRERNTLFIVTSDHGQSLGEGGWFFHSHGQPRDELVRVPLAIHFPDSAMTEAAQDRTNDWVSLVDLAPTIAKIVGVVPWDHLDGVSLLDSESRQEHRPTFCAGDGPLIQLTPKDRRARGSKPARSASCVAFVGDARLAVSGHGTEVDAVERQSAEPAASASTADLSGLPVDRVVQTACWAVLTMLSALPTPAFPSVDRRLAAWGYG